MAVVKRFERGGIATAHERREPHVVQPFQRSVGAWLGHLLPMTPAPSRYSARATNLLASGWVVPGDTTPTGREHHVRRSLLLRRPHRREPRSICARRRSRREPAPRRRLRHARAPSASRTAPASTAASIEVDGHPRRFVVYVPRHRPVTGPLRPVVFMFHGSTGTGEQFLRSSGWREQADATGLVAVFPTGLRYRVLDSGRLSTKWNSFDLAGEVDLDERPRGYPEDAPVAGGRRRLRRLDHGRPGRTAADRPRARVRVRVLQRRRVRGAPGRRALASCSPRRRSAAARCPPPRRRRGRSRRGSSPGRCDDRILAHTGPPPLTELPLDPVSLLAEPVIDTTLDAHLATLGLDENLVGTLAARGLDGLPLARDRRGPGRRRVPLLTARRARSPLPARAQQRRRVRGRAGVLGVLPDSPPAVTSERPRQLRPAGHVELAICAGQVHLDRPAGEEEGFGDLAVAQPVVAIVATRRSWAESESTPLNGGASRARAGGAQLVQRPIGLDQRTAPVREVEPFAQRLAGVAAMAAAPQRGAEVDQRPRVGQPEVGAGEDLRRLARPARPCPRSGRAARARAGLRRSAPERRSAGRSRAPPRRARGRGRAPRGGPGRGPHSCATSARTGSGRRGPALAGRPPRDRSGRRRGSPIRRASRPREASAWLMLSESGSSPVGQASRTTAAACSSSPRSMWTSTSAESALGRMIGSSAGSSASAATASASAPPRSPVHSRADARVPSELE